MEFLRLIGQRMPLVALEARCVKIRVKNGSFEGKCKTMLQNSSTIGQKSYTGVFLHWMPLRCE